MWNQALCARVYSPFCLGSPVLSLCLTSEGAPAATFSQVLTMIPLLVNSCPYRCSGLHRPQTEAEVLEQSARTLRAHVVALLSAICRSVRACPVVVRATFRQLFQRVQERFPSAQHQVRPLCRSEGRERKGILQDVGLGRQTSLIDQSLLSAPFQNVPFIAVTSFLCLRFFSPAIMSPKLFHLRERHADARTSRTLLLLAKVWTCRLEWEGQLGCSASAAPIGTRKALGQATAFP